MQLPLFLPPSDWVEPTSLPTIPSGVELAIDTETRDNGLANERGPGWATNDGHIAGISVAWNSEKHYIPMRHPDTRNMEPSEVARWIQDAMGRSRKNIFHNSGYDAGWFGTDNITLDESKAEDTQYMAVMLDENQLSYSLENECKRNGVPGKDEQSLREAAATFGLDPKKDMWKLPAKYVAKYAAQDASATLELYKKLAPKIEEQGVMDAYRLEMDLVPVTLAMRKRGVRVNENVAFQVQRNLRSQSIDLLKGLKEKLGYRREITIHDINSPAFLEDVFTKESVSFPRTPKTKVGSFSSKWMKDATHWLPRAVIDIRQLNDLAEKFIGTYILDSVHMGRIHAEIHQLRDDDGGTRSYRLSYSNPPLQQMPTRTENSRLIRSMFEPEKDCLWDAEDYSQQEPRMAVHFASVCKITGAEDAVRYYCDDPSADFHTMVAEITGLTRKQAKIINLGLMYGMGIPKLANDLGVTVEEAIEIVNQYNERMPFIRKLAEFCEKRAEIRGYIKLLDGARCRFDLWELAWGKEKFAATSLDKALVMANGQRLKRAHVRKSMNRLIQGSAARQTKLAMRQCYREGLVPLLQMHDELDFNVSTEKESLRAREIMTDIVKLRIPMKVDGAYGHNWGQASEEPPKGIEPPTFSELMKYGKGVSNTEIIKNRTA